MSNLDVSLVLKKTKTMGTSQIMSLFLSINILPFTKLLCFTFFFGKKPYNYVDDRLIAKDGA